MSRFLRMLAILLVLPALPAGSVPAPDAGGPAAARYKQLLAARPEAGLVLDRLWEAYAGRTADLIGEYKQLAAAGDASAALVYGHLLVKAGWQDEAAGAFRQAAVLTPGDARPREALGALFESDSRHAEAAAEFAAAAGLAPENAGPARSRLLRLAGSAWLAAGEVPRAIGVWEQAVAAAPGDRSARRELARTCENEGMFDQAATHYRQLAATGKADEKIDALRALARVEEARGSVAEARNALDQGLASTQPGSWAREELQTELIRLHQRAQQTDELEKSWIAQVESSPRDLGAYYQLVAFYRETGSLDDEVAWLRKVAGLAPRERAPREELARLLRGLGQLDEAAALLDGLLELQPANPDWVLERAEIDLSRGAVDAAATRALDLAASKPADGELRARVVAFCLRHKLLDAAESLLRQAADARPADDADIEALARFYFSRDRSDDALGVLARLIPQGATAQLEAAGEARMARILQGEGRLKEASDRLLKAIELAPEEKSHRESLTEVLIATGDYTEARRHLEILLALTDDERARAEVDRKIFQILRAEETLDEKQEASAVPRGERDVLAVESLLRLASGVSTGAGDRIKQALGEIQATAERNETAGGWMRLARWQRWSGDPAAALVSAGKALDHRADPVVANEFILETAHEAGRFDLALRQLDELERLQPERAAALGLERARVQMAAKQPAQAAATLQALADASPGSAALLAELARAQAGAGRRDDALSTLREAFKVSTPANRDETLTSLVKALEEAGFAEEAAQTLDDAITADGEGEARTARMEALIPLCSRNGLLDWLSQRLSGRLTKRPNDPFLQQALAEVLREMGRPGEAMDYLARSQYSSPDRIKTLSLLVGEAEESGQFELAAKFQSQLVVLEGYRDAAGLQRLAGLQEMTFHLDEAAATWERVLRGFPRQTEFLLRAARFFGKFGHDGRAADILHQVVTLDPADAANWLALGALEVRLGRREPALRAFREVLARTGPVEAVIEPEIPPYELSDPRSMQAGYLRAVRRQGLPDERDVMRSFGEGAGAGDELPTGGRAVRLRAIREAALIVAVDADAETRKRWVSEWVGRAEREPWGAVWALYYSSAGAELVSLLDRVCPGVPEDTALTQAAIWLGLRAGEFGWVAGWASAGGATRRDLFTAAIGQLVASGEWNVGAEDFAKCFPAGVWSTEVLWQCASRFAAVGRYAEAIELGRRVFEQSASRRPLFGVPLAEWCVTAGRVGEARAILARSLDGPRESFSAPSVQALRLQFLLLPGPDRAPFAAQIEAQSGGGGSGSGAHLALALLDMLSGRESSANDHLQRLIDLSAQGGAGVDYGEFLTPTARNYWAFVLASGVQLESWGLSDYAAWLWERALADRALIRLQADTASDLTGEVQLRLEASRFRAAGPAARRQLLAGMAAGAGGQQRILQMADLFERNGEHANAVRLRENLWESQPDNPNYLMSLLNTCRMAGARDTAARALTTLLDRKDGGTREVADRAALSLRLADILREDGRPLEAAASLEQAISRNHLLAPLLHRLAELYESSGQIDRAVATYRRILAGEQKGNEARLELARLLTAIERKQEALEVLATVEPGEAKSGGGIDYRLAMARLAAGDAEGAVRLVGRLVQQKRHDGLPGFCGELAKQRPDMAGRAAAMLHAAASESTSRPLQYELQKSLVSVLAGAAGGHDEWLRRAGRQLEILARRSPALVVDYYSQRISLLPDGADTADLRAELARRVREGRVELGGHLLGLQVAAGDTAGAAATSRALLDDPTTPREALARVVEFFLDNDMDAKALPFARKLAREFPGDLANGLMLARVLDLAGEKADAAAEIDVLAARHAFSAMSIRPLAHFCDSIGQVDGARGLFQLMVSEAPPASWPMAARDFAGFLLKCEDYPSARLVLKELLRNPGADDLRLLARYVAASGRADRLESEISEFQLDEAGASMVRELVQSGRAGATGQP